MNKLSTIMNQCTRQNIGLLIFLFLVFGCQKNAKIIVKNESKKNIDTLEIMFFGNTSSSTRIANIKPFQQVVLSFNMEENKTEEGDFKISYQFSGDTLYKNKRFGYFEKSSVLSQEYLVIINLDTLQWEQIK